MKFSIAPLITEKTLANVEENNVYTFAVRESKGKATAFDIRGYVHSEYDVEVKSVNVTRRSGKIKRAGQKRTEYKRPDVKLFFVKLAKGDKIDEFNLETGDKN